MREFGKFVTSPFYNTNKKVEQLYNIIKKHYPKFKPRTIKLNKIFNTLYPGSKSNNGIIRNLFSELSLLAENYLVITDYKQDKFDYQKRLMTQLNIRKLDNMFEKGLEKAFILLDQEKIKDENHYLRHYMLETLKCEYFLARTPVGKSLPLYQNRKNMIDQFMHNFLITMLKEYFDMHNAEGLLKFEHQHVFFEEIMNHLSRHKKEYNKIVLIDILYRFILLYRNNEEMGAEDELKELIESSKDQISYYDYRNFMLELYNYYKDKRAEGNINYGTKSFELMNDMLKNGIFYQMDGHISSHTFINLVSAALLEKQIDWAENFNNQYKDKLPVDQRESAFLFSYANIHYIRGAQSNPKLKSKHFNKALDYLAKVKSEDFYYMSRIKNMLARIYYDLNEIEHAISIVGSYKKFLSKSKSIPENLYEQYYNFITFVYKLIKFKTGTSKITPEQLKDEIISTQLLAYRGWLLEKVTEFDTYE